MPNEPSCTPVLLNSRTQVLMHHVCAALVTTLLQPRNIDGGGLACLPVCLPAYLPAQVWLNKTILDDLVLFLHFTLGRPCQQ